MLEIWKDVREKIDCESVADEEVAEGELSEVEKLQARVEAGESYG